MSAFADTLDELKARGLLDRVLKLKVGDTEILMDGVPQGAPDADPPPKLTDEQMKLEERRLYAETMYGAASGTIPGLDEPS